MTFTNHGLLWLKWRKMHSFFQKSFQISFGYSTLNFQQNSLKIGTMRSFKINLRFMTVSVCSETKIFVVGPPYSMIFNKYAWISFKKFSWYKQAIKLLDLFWYTGKSWSFMILVDHGLLWYWKTIVVKINIWQRVCLVNLNTSEDQDHVPDLK
jgi:hypothetical protein